MNKPLFSFVVGIWGLLFSSTIFSQTCPNNLLSNSGAELPFNLVGVPEPFPVGEWYFPNTFFGLPIRSTTARANSGTTSFYLPQTTQFVMFQDIDISSQLSAGTTVFDCSYYFNKQSYLGKQPTITPIVLQLLNSAKAVIWSKTVQYSAAASTLTDNVWYPNSDTIMPVAGTQYIRVRVESGYQGNFAAVYLDDICLTPKASRAPCNLSVLMSGNPTICAGNSTTLTATVTGGTAPFTYQWSNGATTSSTTVSPNATTSYSVTVTDANGCTQSASQNVLVNSIPTVSNVNITPNTTNNTSTATLVGIVGGTTPYKYSLDSLSWQPDSVFTNLLAGTYKFFIADANSCGSVKTNIIVWAPSVWTLYLANKIDILCFGEATGQIAIAGTGNAGSLTYSKDGGATWQTSPIFPNLKAGTYTLIAKDANGTTNTVVVTLTQPASLPSFTVAKNNLSCASAADGSITITAMGGTYPYRFTINGWTAYTNSNVFTGLSAGSYKTQVKDVNGCLAAVQTVRLTQPSAINFSTNITTSCNGNGKIKVTKLTGGNGGPYQFSKDAGATWQVDSVFDSLLAGSYSIKVKDTSGCMSTTKLVSIASGSISFSLNTRNISCNKGSYIYITSVSNGTAPYQYSKNGGITFQNFPYYLNLPAGTYSMQVKDNNGCLSAVQNVTITNTCTRYNVVKESKSAQLIPTVILKMSPNPTVDLLDIELNSLTEQEQTFMFFDVTGKLHKQETRSLDKGLQHVQIDCSDLSQGVYELLIDGSKGKAQPSRFVKL